MIREDFPEMGNPSYMDGECDGWEFRIFFRGNSLQASYDMVRAFLVEEGYANVPIPANADELKRFRDLKKKQQASLFEEKGYVHNPVKILFPLKARFKNTLELRIYNEKSPGHLLRFHGVEPI